MFAKELPSFIVIQATIYETFYSYAHVLLSGGFLSTFGVWYFLIFASLVALHTLRQ